MALHHKLCHVLGGSFGLPHAETHAVVLPHAAAYNAAAAGDLLAPVTRRARRRRHRARRSPASPRRIGAPRALRDLGMAEADLDRAADLAVEAPYWNPRPVERAAVRRLLAAAWAGEPPAGMMPSPAARSRSSAPASAGSPRRSRWRGAAPGSRCFEQAPALAEVGAGIQIAPNGVAVLEALGLGAAAEPHASPPEAVELRDHRGGRLVARLPLGATVARRHGRPVLAVPPRRSARRPRRRRRRGRGRAPARRPACSASRRRAPGFACGPRAAPEPRRRDRRSRPTACARAMRGRRISPAAPPRFTGHVAWRSLVAAARLPASGRRAGDPGDDGAGTPPRQLSAARRAAGERRRDRGARRLDRRGLDDARRSREPPPRLRRLGRRGRGAPRRGRRRLPLGPLRPSAAARAGARGGSRCSATPATRCCPSSRRARRMALEDAWVLAAALDRAADPAAGLAAYAAARLPRATRVQRAAARERAALPPAPGLARAGAPRRSPPPRPLAPALLARRGSTGCSATTRPRRVDTPRRIRQSRRTGTGRGAPRSHGVQRS